MSEELASYNRRKDFWACCLCEKNHPGGSRYNIRLTTSLGHPVYTQGIHDHLCVNCYAWLRVLLETKGVKDKKKIQFYIDKFDVEEPKVCWQDENRTTTEVERVYDTRWDCRIGPGIARLIA